MKFTVANRSKIVGQYWGDIMTSKCQTDFIFYRIGGDGEWEQCRTTERLPNRAACKAVDMIADVLERTKEMSPVERDMELERVLQLVDQI